MAKSIKVLLGLMSVLMALLWLQIMINPQQFAQQLFLLPNGAEGLNTFRADVGGIFFAGGIFSLLALIQNNRQWALAAALLMIGAAIGRCTGLVMEGFNSTSAGSLLFELILAGLFLLAYKKL